MSFIFGFNLVQGWTLVQNIDNNMFALLLQNVDSPCWPMEGSKCLHSFRCFFFNFETRIAILKLELLVLALKAKFSSHDKDNLLITDGRHFVPIQGTMISYFFGKLVLLPKVTIFGYQKMGLSSAQIQKQRPLYLFCAKFRPLSH